MSQLGGFIRDLGENAYASGRSRTILRNLEYIPRETHQVLESKIDKELKEFEDKLISFCPNSVKDDLTLFLKGKREIEELKIQFRNYHKERKRREGIKVLQYSKWGEKIEEKMSNKEIELTLDKQWFHVMKSTKFREFIIDLEQLYMQWYKSRSEGKKFTMDPMPLIDGITNKDPLGWGVVLKCYYKKLEQIQKRRKAAWEGY
jgi:hypothetical protein